MKKAIFYIIAVLTLSQGYSQNIADALRYSTDDLYGTARVQGLSGAFTSLGGDISAISINPASSAVFIDNAAGLSVGLPSTQNNAFYFDGASQAIDTDININQAGGVFVFDNNDASSKWRKFSFGITFNNTNNYDNSVSVLGNGNQSISSFFLNQAQGIPLNLLELQGNESIDDLYTFLGETEGVGAQNAFLGYQGFIIDPVENTSTNSAYTSAINGNRFSQDYLSNSRGSKGKYTFNFGTQYDDFLYLGANINSHTIDFRNQNSLIETNTSSSVNRVFFENNLATYGSGFSAQIGAIAKLKNFRVGLTVDTPTWMEISEETSQFLETRGTIDGVNTTITVNPNVINIFEPYRLRTPGKISVGTSYVFGKQGFLSFDYGYKDYSNIEFSYFDTAAPFNGLNNAITNELQAASTYRLGGEYLFNNVSLRGGYRFEETPYKNESRVGDLTGISLGFGYKFKNYLFDIGYSYAEQDQAVSLYNTGLTNPAFVETSFSNAVFTFQVQL